MCKLKYAKILGCFCGKWIEVENQKYIETSGCAFMINENNFNYVMISWVLINCTEKIDES